MCRNHGWHALCTLISKLSETPPRLSETCLDEPGNHTPSGTGGAGPRIGENAEGEAAGEALRDAWVGHARRSAMAYFVRHDSWVG